MSSWSTDSQHFAVARADGLVEVSSGAEPARWRSRLDPHHDGARVVIITR